MIEILAIIPARSGSKSVIDKNIREIDGKPMIAYSIEHAKSSKLINRVIVSTDSEEYAAMISRNVTICQGKNFRKFIIKMLALM